MANKSAVTKSPLRALREAAGLSQRELARLIGQEQSNVRYWETSDTLPRSDVLIPLARVLGVTVEELLGHPPSRKRANAPPGKLGRLFDNVARLPRRQQEKIIELLEPYVSHHANSTS
ncbi:MAG: helix-turn-helix domain-containing protein [Gammaproteobacteria bacterium]